VFEGGGAEIETFYLDIDGDGLGEGTAYELCNGIDLAGWATNNDDTEPSCSTNNTDECGVCDGGNSSCSDCAGTPHGDAYEDQCGTCDSEGSNDCVQDCAGEWGGNAYLDACDVCDSDSSNDCVQDCAGSWGGSLVNDECGVCGGDGSSCVVCADGTSIPDGECDCEGNVVDCTGECGGDAEIETFYLDIDGDGLGAGSAYLLCNGLSLTGWVLNNNDTDDNCASNYHDCAGVCDGTYVVDECGDCGGDGIDAGKCDCAGNVLDCAGVCDGTSVADNCGTCDSDSSNDCIQDCAGAWGGTAAYTVYYQDTDGDGYGAGSANVYCSAFVPAGWVENNSDVEPDCFSNNTDACNICGGDNSSCSDCAGVINGSAYFDPNCGNGTSCVGGTTGSTACTQDCAAVWGGSAVEEIFYCTATTYTTLIIYNIIIC
jgi:hypothetical protein